MCVLVVRTDPPPPQPAHPGAGPQLSHITDVYLANGLKIKDLEERCVIEEPSCSSVAPDPVGNASERGRRVKEPLVRGRLASSGAATPTEGTERDGRGSSSRFLSFRLFGTVRIAQRASSSNTRSTESRDETAANDAPGSDVKRKDGEMRRKCASVLQVSSLCLWTRIQ